MTYEMIGLAAAMLTASALQSAAAKHYLLHDQAPCKNVESCDDFSFALFWVGGGLNCQVGLEEAVARQVRVRPLLQGDMQ